MEGLKQLAFYIKELKKELSVSNDCYMERQNDILHKIRNSPKNVMSNYISKYAYDLEEIVECGVCYVFDTICMDAPNIDILQFLINGMNIGAETGYNQSILKIRNILLERLWNLVFFENRLPFNIQENLIDVHPKFLSDLLTSILDKIYQNGFDNTDLMLVRMDLTFQKILRLCQLYKKAFQVAYIAIAKRMMIKSHSVVQTFLDNFLTDVKSSMRISEFPYHYDDELINYVVILNECNVEDDGIVRHFLTRLKEFNYLNFTILLTHYPKFMYLFD